ncbi:MAG: hypothetical protein DMC60_12455 [Verrucomicrobia bacterium]|nr:MAG: hypothetical protein DMC60_12455 [Verrucomicrobiota bacterium]
MTNANRVRMIRFLAFAVLRLGATSWAQTRPPILEQIAKTYGLDSWDKIQAIRYTWNGEIPGLFKVSHAWEWEPKTGKISYEGKDKEGKPVKVTYMSSELNSQPDTVKNEVEPAFVNDNYWLLFPFHAYWDTSATVSDKGMQKLPVGTGSAELASVKYPAEAGGYTPGDTWDALGTVKCWDTVAAIALETDAEAEEFGQFLDEEKIAAEDQDGSHARHFPYLRVLRCGSPRLRPRRRTCE